jgi:hypothetical protein
LDMISAGGSRLPPLLIASCGACGVEPADDRKA